PWSISIRSSTVNRPFFSMLIRTATTTSSYSREHRPMMSRWPLVTGSKDPGQTTRRKAHPPDLRVPGGATVPNGRFSVTTHPLLLVSGRPLQFIPAALPLYRYQRVRCQPAAVSQQLQHLDDLPLPRRVRRVGEDEIVRLRGRAGEPAVAVREDPFDP